MRVFGWKTLMRNESEGVACPAEVGTLYGGTIDRSSLLAEI